MPSLTPSSHHSLGSDQISNHLWAFLKWAGFPLVQRNDHHDRLILWGQNTFQE